MVSDGEPQRIRHTGEFECEGSVQGVLYAGFASALTGAQLLRENALLELSYGVGFNMILSKLAQLYQ